MDMKKLAYAFLVASACGCQTRITATKNPEQILPIQKVESVNGTNVLVTTGYDKASGGWEATARSPLWATESLRGLDLEVATNGTVRLAIDTYSRDLSTNAVEITKVMINGLVTATEKITAAVVSAGGSTAASGASSAIAALAARFIDAGGDADSATVTCKDGSCTITDGTTTCTDGSCYESK